MQLKDLANFQKIADLGSLHAAASAMGLTQPALSKSVHRLEAALEVRLFERTARGVALTDVGRALYARNLTLAQLVDDIRTEVGDFKAGQAGQLRIGSVPALVDTVVSPALVNLLAADTPASFHTQVQLSNALLRELTAGRLDLALAALQDHVAPELSYSVLGTQTSRIVARQDHPLLRRDFALADLTAYRWVLPPGDVALRAWVDALFSRSGLRGPALFVQADASPVAFASLVRGSDLLSVLTADSLASPAAAGLAALPSPAPSWQLQIALFWRRSAYFSAPMRACRDELTRRFAERDAETRLTRRPKARR